MARCNSEAMVEKSVGFAMMGWTFDVAHAKKQRIVCKDFSNGGMQFVICWRTGLAYIKTMASIVQDQYSVTRAASLKWGLISLFLRRVI